MTDCTRRKSLLSCSPYLSIVKQRLDILLSRIVRRKIGGLLVACPENVSYLCGYNISDSYLLVCPRESFLITDFRYIEEAEKNIFGFSLKKRDGPLSEAVAAIVKKLRIRCLGFEAATLSFALYQGLRRLLGRYSKLVPLDYPVEKLREIKSEKEIACIRSSARLAHRAMRLASKLIRPGARERDICAEINKFIRVAGAQGSAFEIIVAGGARSSRPHALTGKSRIEAGQVTLVDLGVDLNGYKSDLTRVFFTGSVSPKTRKVLQVVRRAQQQALEAIAPGVKISRVDKAARDYIVGFGWGDNFGHSLGHGLGLNVHEAPAINSKNNRRLKAGMVFTVEPGVYFP
ncbi:MAG: M24 family metallopeptidase, partial [Candidatus Omnitrophota bacterium]